jgi:hypothetical protein
MVKTVALLLALLALAACNRSKVESKEAVRQGVLDYLANRPNLSIGNMNVTIASVTFNGNQANALVAFAPKGGAAGAQGMTIPYTLERQGERWVVKKGAGQNPHGGMGGGMSPHGGSGTQPAPGAGAQIPSPGDIVPPHPSGQSQKQ